MKNKVLVTGAEGFIGSHLVEQLLKKGFKVRALVQYNSFSNRGWLEDIKKSKNLEIIFGDIRSLDMTKDLTKGISKVFHLAALISIPYSYKTPDSYFETNVKGTLNILESSKSKIELKRKFVKIYKKLLSDDNLILDASSSAERFIKKNAGATNRIINDLVD